MATKVPLLRLVAALAGMTLGGLPLHRAGAQSVGTTDPVGVVTIALPAQSDTRVSIPFVRPAPFAGTVQSVSGNVLSVAEAPNWSANRFAFSPQAGQHDTFFVLLGPRAGTVPTPKEGCFYTVTANGANTLTVDLNGDDVSAVQPGTRVTLIPYWTLGTAFPATDVNRSFAASVSPSQPATTVLVAQPVTSSVNPPAAGGAPPNPPPYYFYAGAWRRTDLDPGVVCDDDVLYPDGHFIVRNPAATALSFRPAGGVLTARLTVPVPVPTAGTQIAFPAGLPRPLPITLNNTGLIASGAIRPNETGTGDAVAIFNNAAAGYNPAPSATYFYSAGAWRQSGAPATQDFGAVPVLLPGAGFLLAKAAGNGATVFWQNAPDAPGLIGVFSRKVHGAAGPFDLVLPWASGATPAIESRGGGANGDYTLVFAFAAPLTAAPAAAVSSGVATIASVGLNPGDATQVLVNLTGVANAQYLSVALTNVGDGANPAGVRATLGVLIGDFNASGRTDMGDVTLIRNFSGQMVTTANFRADLNADGSINSADISFARSHSVSALPAPPPTNP